jgi:hypothetical protein
MRLCALGVDMRALGAGEQRQSQHKDQDDLDKEDGHDRFRQRRFRAQASHEKGAQGDKHGRPRNGLQCWIIGASGRVRRHGVEPSKTRNGMDKGNTLREGPCAYEARPARPETVTTMSAAIKIRRAAGPLDGMRFPVAQIGRNARPASHRPHRAARRAHWRQSAHWREVHKRHRQSAGNART